MREETGGWWGATMERQLHGTVHGVQAHVKAREQPEPINFHIPFQSDLETKRVAFSVGHSVQGEGEKKKGGGGSDSAISKFRGGAGGMGLKR